MAVHVTIVSPKTNSVGASFVTVTELTESSVVDATRNMTLFSNEFYSAITSLDATIDGAVVSTMVTNCVADAELPDESVVVHVTIVSPN